MRRFLVLALVSMTLLSPGCLSTFRVEVSASALEAADLEWVVETFDEEGDTFGLKIKETRYVHRGDDDREPPFPGVLQIFALRGNDATKVRFLEERAHSVVDEAIETEGIVLDESKSVDGTRSLRSGVDTKWFLREGTIESGEGDFFDPVDRIRVRVLAEVGADGRGSTGFIAVAFVKVEDHQDGIAGGVGGRTVTSDATWFDVVADPKGSITGATFSDPDRGLIHNLVTHG